MQLRPYASVVRRECAIRQRGPEAAHSSVEALRARGRDDVVFTIDELQIGPEARDAAEVAAIVRAKRAGNRRRVDEPREGRPDAGEGEVIALAIVQLRNARSW